MVYKSTRHFVWHLAWVIGLVAMVGTSAKVEAEELKFQVQLIWGTDGKKPEPKKDEPPIKDVEEKLQKKLRAVFRWHNYFEINRKKGVIREDQVRRFRMSSKCVVEVRRLGKSSVEVTLIGDGKEVIKKRQTIVPGKLTVFAGEDKNDTAWFVILTPK